MLLSCFVDQEEVLPWDKRDIEKWCEGPLHELSPHSPPSGASSSTSVTEQNEAREGTPERRHSFTGESWGDDELPTQTIMHYSTHLDANVLAIFKDFHLVVLVVSLSAIWKNRLRPSRWVDKNHSQGSVVEHQYCCTRDHDELPTQNNALFFQGTPWKIFPDVC